MLISIVVPAFNEDGYLGETLASLNHLRVVPSVRRFDQWPLWRTLVWTNPLFILLFQRGRHSGMAGTRHRCDEIAGSAQQIVAGERVTAPFSTSFVRRGLRVTARAT
jgi:hypothetical protein